MSRWYLSLLGPLSLVDNQTGQTLTRFRTTKGMQLIAYLGRHPGAPYPRELIGEALWPDTDPTLQLKRLRYEASIVNSHVEPEFLTKPGNSQLALSPDSRSDLGDFYELVQQSQLFHEPRARIPGLRSAVTAVLSRPAFLTGFFDDWVLEERTEFDNQLRQALQSLILDLANDGQRTEAEQFLLVLQQRFPDDPPFVLPPPPPPSYKRRHPLSTLWIGRELELTALQAWRTEEPGRLLTVTGPGGMGKTRLACEAFPDACFVSLAESPSAEQLWPLLLATLGCTQRDDRPLEAQALEALETQALPYLLLDNAEHLLPELSPLVARVLALPHAPRCIVTSRSPLQLPDETILRLKGLPLQDAQALFIDRARALRPEFEPTSDVGVLCELLEGIPLALELAAARILLLGTRQILDQLRLSLLKNRRASPQDRHRSLHATIDWSVSLLPERLHTLFKQLSVFRGGFTLEAAEHCFHGELDDLEELYEHSLLEQHRDPQDSARYSLLTVIREFAEELLPLEEKTLLLDLHIDYFAGFAQKVHATEQRGDWKNVSAQIFAEYENLRVATDHICKESKTQLIVPFTEALFQSYFELGYWEDLDKLLTYCESVVSKSDMLITQARCYGWRAALYRRRGNNSAAWPYWQKRLTIFEQLSDREQILQSLWEMMGQSIDTNTLDEAYNIKHRLHTYINSNNSPHELIFFNVLCARLESAKENNDQATIFGETAKSLIDKLTEHDITKQKHAYNYYHYYLIPIYRKSRNYDHCIQLIKTFSQMAFHQNQLFFIGYTMYEYGKILADQEEYLSACKTYFLADKIHQKLGSRLKTETHLTFHNFLIQCSHRSEVQQWLDEVKTCNKPWQEIYQDIAAEIKLA